MESRHNLNRLAYFVAVVEEGTITAAAIRLGLSKAVVSKHLQLLEKEVGVSLLIRNTRHIQPTESGQAFFAGAKAALIQADEAFDVVKEHSSVPSGRLKITAPVDYGVTHVAPLIAKFCQTYPRVTVELDLSDEQVDIVDQRFDVAFRIGWLKDSSNIARKLRNFNEIVVCSPATAKHYSITQPEELSDIPFVTSRALGHQTKWAFHRDDETRTIQMSSTLGMNITLAIREAVIAGSSCTILPDFLIAEELAKNRLTTLLPDWSLRSGGVYAVSPPSRLRTRAVQIFLTMAQEAACSDE